MYEQLNLLQGSHYDIVTPEFGYYTGYTPPLPRLGLPALKMQDGSTGFRTTQPGTEGSTTTWPCLLSLASTWDEDIVGRVAQEMGAEFKGKGANVMIGPSINVLRLAANGRSFESLSGDDPFLGSRMVSSFIKGVQSQGVMCAVKHVGFSDQETNRVKYNSVVDQRTAWELYYPPVEAAVQAGVGAVMCGYNKVNDTYACHNPDILKRDLREVMGFQGMVLSQWGGVRGIDAMENGVDVEMPGRNRKGPGRFNLNQIVTVDPNVVQEATIHVRKAIYSVGLDKDPESCVPPFCKDHLYSNQRSPQRSALAREAAMKSVTLLKNDDNILPLDTDKISKIALLGSASFLVGTGMVTNADYLSGGGSSHSNWVAGIQTLFDVMKEREKWMETIELLTIKDVNSNLQAMMKLSSIASADVIVVVAGATSSETMDRPTLALDDFADDFIRALGALNKPTVVLMQTPGAVLTPFREYPHVKAIANIFLGGEGTAKAWSGLLFGDYAPSGKLPVHFPASDADVVQPTFSLQVNYTEGLFTSYRNSKFRAAYPFGHGLTYTNFTISAPKQITTNCSAVACIKVTVENVGRRTGTEVPQAYVEFAPELREPKLVLKGFQKVQVRPGHSKDVIFSFSERDLSVYRADFGWMPQRVVRVHVGSSSANLGDPVILRVRRDSSSQPRPKPQPAPQMPRLRTQEEVALQRQRPESPAQEAAGPPRPREGEATQQPLPQLQEEPRKPEPEQAVAEQPRPPPPPQPQPQQPPQAQAQEPPQAQVAAPPPQQEQPPSQPPSQPPAQPPAQPPQQEQAQAPPQPQPRQEQQQQQPAAQPEQAAAPPPTQKSSTEPDLS